jgi:hypothetical protein
LGVDISHTGSLPNFDLRLRFTGNAVGIPKRSQQCHRYS